MHLVITSYSQNGMSSIDQSFSNAGDTLAIEQSHRDYTRENTQSGQQNTKLVVTKACKGKLPDRAVAQVLRPHL
jgi:hypothetical protein